MRHNHRACRKHFGHGRGRSVGFGTETVSTSRTPRGLAETAEQRLQQVQEFAERLRDAVNEVTAASPLARSIVQMFADRLGARDAASLGVAYWKGLVPAIDGEGNLMDFDTNFMFSVYSDSIAEGSSPPTGLVWFSYPAFALPFDDVALLAVHEVLHACSMQGTVTGSLIEEVFSYFTEAVILEQWRGTPLDVAAQSERIRGYLSQGLYDGMETSTPDDLVNHLELNGVRQVFDSASWDRIIGYVRGYSA